MQYTTDHYPIKRDYWYIISFRDFKRLTLYSVYFLHKVDAERALALHVYKRNKGKYKIIRGKKLKQYYLTYTINIGILSKFTKYDYPPGVKKKNYRTVMRRRLRRMGALTLVKTRLHIGETVKQARLINNTQLISKRGSKNAQAFALARKPKRYRYILLSKQRSELKGILFNIKALRVNIKDNTYTKVEMNLRNRDLLTPYLVTEILEMTKDKTHERILKYCRKRGIRIPKSKPEKGI